MNIIFSPIIAVTVLDFGFYSSLIGVPFGITKNAITIYQCMAAGR